MVLSLIDQNIFKNKRLFGALELQNNKQLVEYKIHDGASQVVLSSEGYHSGFRITYNDN